MLKEGAGEKEYQREKSKQDDVNTMKREEMREKKQL